MIAYIKGILDYVAEGFAIVEAGGIGYQIAASGATLSKLPPVGSETKLYTHMSVKEDGVSLFGFYSMQELDLFHKLITVTGVGPKAALGFLAQLTPSELVIAILSEDVAILSKTPGIGKKTAQRVILELKDNLKGTDFIEQNSAQNNLDILAHVDAKPKHETIEALVSLGYTKSEAAQAVSRVYTEDASTEQLLKLALKKLAASY